jgi:two-component system, OmpR family, response regulator
VSETTAQPLVLVVEDEALLLDELQLALEDAGFRVLAASRGAEALSLLQDEIASIRALVTDVNLGEGTNGWELAHFAREQNAELPVVYASGGTEADWAINGVPKSVFIAKPFAPAQVVVAVSTLLNSGEAGQS